MKLKNDQEKIYEDQSKIILDMIQSISQKKENLIKNINTNLLNFKTINLSIQKIQLFMLDIIENQSSDEKKYNDGNEELILNCIEKTNHVFKLILDRMKEQLEYIGKITNK